jgi:hypothetical protein
MFFSSLVFYEIIHLATKTTHTQTSARTPRTAASKQYLLQPQLFVKQRNQLYESSASVTRLTVYCRAHIGGRARLLQMYSFSTVESS